VGGSGDFRDFFGISVGLSVKILMGVRMSQSRRGEQTLIDAAAARFERQWNTGPDRPRIEDCLAEADPNRRLPQEYEIRV
jgi:hypothetical protein